MGGFNVKITYHASGRMTPITDRMTVDLSFDSLLLHLVLGNRQDFVSCQARAHVGFDNVLQSIYFLEAIP